MYSRFSANICRFLITWFAVFGFLCEGVAGGKLLHGVIPQPLDYEANSGSILLKSGDFVALPMGKEGMRYLAMINAVSPVKLRMAPADVGCAIQFLSGDMRGRSSQDKLPAMADGAYEIRVLPTTIQIFSDTGSGRFYGLQTLLQLMKVGKKKQDGLELSCMRICDAPRFKWRGFMLDESRHFSGEKEVKRLIDVMAYYKLNRFHWHLTDSDGWRIEIKQYPKLTQIGGVGDRSHPQAPAQFYTQKQIREIVAYAKERYITVIPEIDMPGHASAAVRAYPEFGGGGSKKNPNFTFNPEDPATDQFLSNILREVAELFPDAGVIHFGGDEVHFGWEQWPKLPGVKKLMEEKGMKLKDIEKQFNLRFAKKINQLGYQTGGWDEIVEAGLPVDRSLVFWWRHDKVDVLREAFKKGYKVVLCPRLPCYFDFLQDEKHQSGRRWGGIVTLQDTYQFPDSLRLTKRELMQVEGVQACLWTETMKTQKRRDFMTFPRLLALAEAAWTSPQRKDIKHFEKQVKLQLPELKSRGFYYYNPFSPNKEVVQ